MNSNPAVLAGPARPQRRDYRVKVRVLFNIDLGAEDAEQAMNAAEKITLAVFKNDYSRAENVDIDGLDVEEL